MNFDYQQNDIAAGMLKKGMAEETPNIFAERQGAAQVSPSTNLDRPPSEWPVDRLLLGRWPWPLIQMSNNAPPCGCSSSDCPIKALSSTKPR